MKNLNIPINTMFRRLSTLENIISKDDQNDLKSLNNLYYHRPAYLKLSPTNLQELTSIYNKYFTMPS